MASFLRRKRGLIFKAVIAIPILWFAVVTLLAFNEHSSSNTDSENHRGQRNVDTQKIEEPIQPKPDWDKLNHHFHPRMEVPEDENRQVAPPKNVKPKTTTTPEPGGPGK